MSVSKPTRQEGVELVLDVLDLWTSDGGLEEEDALDRLAQALDAAVALDVILGPGIGHLAEAADGPAIRQALEILDRFVEAVRPRPHRLLARAERAEERGRDRVATRLRKRAARLSRRTTRP